MAAAPLSKILKGEQPSLCGATWRLRRHLVKFHGGNVLFRDRVSPLSFSHYISANAMSTIGLLDHKNWSTARCFNLVKWKHRRGTTNYLKTGLYEITLMQIVGQQLRTKSGEQFDILAADLCCVGVTVLLMSGRYCNVGVANTSIAIDRSIAESQLVDRAWFYIELKRYLKRTFFNQYFST